MTRKDETRRLTLEAMRVGPVLQHLSSPLDFIFAEHFRQRVLFGVLDTIADGSEQDVDLIKAAIDYLEKDMKLHVLDEEEDLFPRLTNRAQPEDGIDIVIAQLLEEHQSDHIDASWIIGGLKLVLSSDDDSPFSDEFAHAIKRFTANERRHLIVENAIVLPLARVRLSDDDLSQMSKQMAQRRGIKLPKHHKDG